MPRNTTTAAAGSTAVATTACATLPDGRTGATSAGHDARCHRTTALASSTIERAKWSMTTGGERCVRTVTAPTTTWAAVPATMPHDNQMRSVRLGTRRCAPSTAAMTARATRPETMRLPYSTHAWPSRAGTNSVSVQPGQSVHPSPDPVRRTAAPVTTIAVSATSASNATARKRCGDTSRSIVTERYPAPPGTRPPVASGNGTPSEAGRTTIPVPRSRGLW